jgi:hypothetical protein
MQQFPPTRRSCGSSGPEGLHQLGIGRTLSARTKCVQDVDEQSAVLTLTETAAYLRVSKAHLSNVIKGKVPGVPPLRCARVGRRLLIKRERANEWLEIAGEGSPFNKWECLSRAKNQRL